jgi:hypothetical protein
LYVLAELINPQVRQFDHRLFDSLLVCEKRDPGEEQTQNHRCGSQPQQ